MSPQRSRSEPPRWLDLLRQFFADDDPCDAVEHLVDVLSVLRRRLEECEPVRLCQRAPLLGLDCSVRAVALVRNQHLGDVGVCMLINLLEPGRNVVKCLLVSAVVDQDDSHSSLVVCLRNCAESLLAGGVPYLKLDSFVVDVELLDLEINTYRILLERPVPIVGM